MAVIYLCPADKRLLCPWEGPASDIKQHFENEHEGLLCRNNSVEIDLSHLPENRLLCLEEELYLMQNCIENDKLAIKLRYFGSSDVASKIQYDITVTINKMQYKYEPSRYFSCIVPTTESWEVNLEPLEKYHGKLQTLTCSVLLQGQINITRKNSDTSLKINNQFVERNAVDDTEVAYMEALTLVEDKLKELKQQKEENEQQKEDELKQKQRESGDFMDKISLLNFSMLEEGFNSKHEEYKSEYLSEVLPNIPEELNLSCSSCHLDMLPPIYLCTNGHNVCSWCKSKPCKICGSTITITRNTDLENISRTHLHQCRYSPEGCNERLLYNEVRAHEARCQFCKYKCMSDCPYEGKFDHFTNHLKIVHSSVKLGLSTRADFPKNSEMYVVNKSVGIFYCKSEPSFNNEFVIWKATFCGPVERQFFCEITFKGSKYKEAIFLKRRGNVYEIRKPVAELKKNKAKEKYAVLTITSYDS